MTTLSAPSRIRAGLALVASLAAAGIAVLGVPGSAAAAPGDNGDVKIHSTTTAVDNPKDEPKVCQFYLDAFNFDGLQEVTYNIDPQPDQKGSAHLSGSITLDANGDGHTGTLSLPDGQYKLEWTFEGEKGAGKHKVFKVSCPPGGTTGGGTVPGGGADTGTGAAAAGMNLGQAGAGIAVALGALYVGTRLLRRNGRNRPGSR
ncbi:hypothetical protein [Yinghuangia seranimata]|uniref:hypothetical protein n=1 Tax=Yinghuangia seranimata TaxID=408067 RepID=UPI00248CB44B|nr:hypothetical protein [Yinghuangia seranimata]MDI2132813.1 hypothetical protein [Yinghuangia seranimata]